MQEISLLIALAITVHFRQSFLLTDRNQMCIRDRLRAMLPDRIMVSVLSRVMARLRTTVSRAILRHRTMLSRRLRLTDSSLSRDRRDMHSRHHSLSRLTDSSREMLSRRITVMARLSRRLRILFRTSSQAAALRTLMLTDTEIRWRSSLTER